MMSGRGLNWRFADLTGQKFGRLTALRRGPNQGVHTRWYCRCECGTERLIRRQNLLNGNTLSCGCYGRQQKREIARSRNAGGHGHSPRGQRTPAYIVWMNMIQRCTNPKNGAWDDYGGRGITVCERWRKFENFYGDMGDVPEGMQLDRIENDGNYEPGNCQWATRSEQVKNQRKRVYRREVSARRPITFRDETHSLAEWARKIGLSKNTLSARLDGGWTIEAALTAPLDTKYSFKRKP